MGIYRMYTGDDNETHLEELSLQSHPNLQESRFSGSFEFQNIESPRFSDFHPAPNRRWTVLLSGRLEIGLGDGSKHNFRPGDIRLIEDVSGHGHTTRYLEASISAVFLIQE